MMGQRWENQKIYAPHDWLSTSSTWLHVYILIDWNIATRDLANVYVWLLRVWGKGDVLVESCAYLCYNTQHLCNTFNSRVQHAYKYPRILTLQVEYHVARSYHIGLTSQKLRKRKESWNINHNAINLQALGHARSLEFDSICVGWLFIARFIILVLIVYSEF